MRDLRVLFVGDSFVAGVGDPQGRHWVGRVVAASFAAGMALRAYNLGVGGDTSSQVAERCWVEARPRVASGADMRLVVSFGANDAAPSAGARRVPFEQSLANLARVLDGAGEWGLRVFVVGPGPVGERVADDWIGGLDAAFAEECTRHAVPYVAVHAALLTDSIWTSEVAAYDGAHPGAGGYASLADLVLDGGWLAWLADRGPR